jgi:hypothetical protein
MITYDLAVAKLRKAKITSQAPRGVYEIPDSGGLVYYNGAIINKKDLKLLKTIDKS